MVKHNRGKNYYICEACGFAYRDKDTANKCENWCKKYSSCNLDITKNALSIKK